MAEGGKNAAIEEKPAGDKIEDGKDGSSSKASGTNMWDVVLEVARSFGKNLPTVVIFCLLVFALYKAYEAQTEQQHKIEEAREAVRKYADEQQRNLRDELAKTNKSTVDIAGQIQELVNRQLLTIKEFDELRQKEDARRGQEDRRKQVELQESIGRLSKEKERLALEIDSRRKLAKIESYTINVIANVERNNLGDAIQQVRSLVDQMDSENEGEIKRLATNKSTDWRARFIFYVALHRKTADDSFLDGIKTLAREHEASLAQNPDLFLWSLFSERYAYRGEPTKALWRFVAERAIANPAERISLLQFIGNGPDLPQGRAFAVLSNNGNDRMVFKNLIDAVQTELGRINGPQAYPYQCMAPLSALWNLDRQLYHVRISELRAPAAAAVISKECIESDYKRRIGAVTKIGESPDAGAVIGWQQTRVIDAPAYNAKWKDYE